MKALHLKLCVAAVLVAVGCGNDDPTGGSGGSGANGTGGDGASLPQGGAGGGDTGGTGSGGEIPARFQPLAQALAVDLAASDAYGVSVAVMENGVVTFAHALGKKDSDGTPLTPNTLMQIGSTTKQMTAAALLKKVEAGDYSLDDTLETALPMLEFSRGPTWDDQILLRHLISHQGGLADFAEWANQPADSRLASYTYGTFAQQHYLMNPPGAFWNYSNPNFVLAGLVTEVADARAWPDIMRQDIFLPLGMNRTFLRKAEVEADGDFSLSFGLPPSGGAARDLTMAQVTDSAWTRPAGLVWSTPTQQAQWAHFLMHGNDQVLSDALREQITSSQVDTLLQLGNLHYGFGMFLSNGFAASSTAYYEVPVWSHGGNTLSFSNELYILPEQDFVIAITSSGYATDFGRSVVTALTTLVDLPEPVAVPKATIDPSTFSRHVGTYNDPFNVATVTITQNGNNLLIDMPALTAAGYTVNPVLTPISNDVFIVQIDDLQLDLTFIADGTFGTDSTYARNRIFVATREPVGPPPPPAASSAEQRERIQRALVEARLDDRPRLLRPTRVNVRGG